MKTDIVACILLLWGIFCPSPGVADTVYLNDGRIIETEEISENEGLVKCYINGITVYYPIEDIDRIERQEINGAKRAPELNRDDTGQVLKPDAKSKLIKRCYELGYRYGLCAAKKINSLQCERKNDIVIPDRCRGKSETEKGMVVGIAEVSAAQKTHIGTAVSSPLINVESTSIGALQEFLIGKTKREVKALVGKPNRVEFFAGHDLWVYGDSQVSVDKAVAFEGDIVKDVVFF